MIKRKPALLLALVASGLVAATAIAAPALADTAGPSTPTNLTNDSQACVTDPASAPYINPNINLDLSATSQDSALAPSR